MRTLKLPFKVNREIISFGADLKGGFSFARGNQVYTEDGFGDLSQADNLAKYEKAIGSTRRKYKLNPKVIACDMHPGYFSTRFAKEYAKRYKINDIRYIQHHHAHIASCMLDNGIKGKVIGVSFDGTGFGTDGNIWGGEIFLAGFKKFDRLFHLDYVAMPGGEVAIREPWRMALSYLHKTYDGGLSKVKIPFLKRIDKNDSKVLLQMIDSGINSNLTSSMGRFFDGVSSLVGIRQRIKFEAEAAIELERIAHLECKERYKTSKYKIEDIVKALVKDLKKAEDPSVISAKFHNTVAYMVKDISTRMSKKYGVKKIVLSGGVFQNKYLVRRLKELFEGSDLLVYFHSSFQTTDASICLGQLAIARN